MSKNALSLINDNECMVRKVPSWQWAVHWLPCQWVGGRKEIQMCMNYFAPGCISSKYKGPSATRLGFGLLNACVRNASLVYQYQVFEPFEDNAAGE